MAAAVEINLDELQAALRIVPQNERIVMVNLLRYRERADYGARTDIPPRTGRDAYYTGYVPPTFGIIRRLGGRVLWFGHVRIPLFAPADEHWDDVLLVEYPSFATTLKLVTDPDYQANVFHRRAALADTRVLATTAGTEIR